MSLDALIMLMGALVAVLPFLGFPNRWDSILFVIAGVIIVLLGIIVRRRHGPRTKLEADAYPEEELEQSTPVRIGHEA